jgi:hypothetical protein
MRANMAKGKSGGGKQHGGTSSRIGRTDERSSPGSGEERKDADGHEAPADLQPEEVENGDTAR